MDELPCLRRRCRGGGDRALHGGGGSLGADHARALHAEEALATRLEVRLRVIVPWVEYASEGVAANEPVQAIWHREVHVCMHERGLGKHERLVHQRDDDLQVLGLEFVRQLLHQFESRDGARVACAAAALISVTHRKEEEMRIERL